MDIMVIGGGGREHAIIKKIKRSPNAGTIYSLPGNGGISEDAVCVPIGAKDIRGIVKFALDNRVDFVVVTPDDPLALGAVDALHEAGIPCFGPVKRAAEIESSKIFAEELMKKYGIPTAKYKAFDDPEDAEIYLDASEYPVVIKADGLALGKGVIIANDRAEARNAVDDMMRGLKFGESGARVVIEEFLQGPEVTVLTLTDGRTIVPIGSSMDHKRALDYDKGKNTGGMGVIAPNPFYTDDIAKECMERIFIPTIRAMEQEGRLFRGCLYFGLMLTKDGPKVIEYNSRFGDPETQAVLQLMDADLLELMTAVEEGRLKDVDVKFKDGAVCYIVLASGGYPESYETGKRIEFGAPEDFDGITIYHSGTKREGDAFVTSGGRVLGVSALRGTLKEAVDAAYSAAGKICFEGMHYRRDIGRSALGGSAE